MEQQEYFFIKMPKHQVDLEDLFGGVYNEDTGEWCFEKSKESAVFDYLNCSSDESQEDMNVFLKRNTQSGDRGSTLISLEGEDSERVGTKSVTYNKRDRLHRANSFNASDSSDESDSSLEDNYRRSRGVRVNDLTRLKHELAKAQLDGV